VLIGQTLAHYRITAAIGAGGMGEVYRATDTKLGREVALKVLPAEMASSPERLERFQREAKALAALDHPAIVTVHSVEEAGGVHFLTMQLVEGQPLDRAVPEGGLSSPRILEIATALADALAAAHEKGIVHRDLKPANVMVTPEGRVKVLDFGLAKFAAAEVTDSSDSQMPTDVQTREGVVMGTVPYMSPEQVSGLRVDHRTDIFSLGVLIYEMATGRRPFEGRSSAELASAILRDAPPSVAELRPELPEELDAVLERCLEKDPRERVQSVRELCDACRALQRDVASSEVHGPARSSSPSARHVVGDSASIAVLPLQNLSADKEQEYFSDGLAEEVITLLSQVAGLKVIARSSSFAFRGKDDDVRRIAAALGVTHVLEGSVRRAGARVRVTTQLVAAADGRQVWSERYDRELSDIFAVQDEIAAAIAGALRLTFSTQGAPQRYTPAPSAYEAYLKAKHHEARVTPEALEEAKRSYESAIALDPRFGLAHVGVAAYWVTQMFFGGCRAHDAVPAARAAVQRALEVDPSLPDAHAVLGYLAALYDLDWAAAARHFEMPATRQIGLPGMVRPMWGTALFVQERADEAVRVAERAVEEDPLEVWPRMSLHAYLQAAGRDREAYEQVSKVLEIDPNLVVARVSVAHFHAAWGEIAEAVTAARDAYRVGPWYQDSIATLAAVLRLSGEEAEARTLVERLGSGEGVGDCRARAVYHVLCGEFDVAANWTEKTIAERDPGMMFYLRFTFFRPLRASPRWARIARMLNLPTSGSLSGGAQP